MHRINPWRRKKQEHEQHKNKKNIFGMEMAIRETLIKARRFGRCCCCCLVFIIARGANAVAAAVVAVVWCLSLSVMYML